MAWSGYRHRYSPGRPKKECPEELIPLLNVVSLKEIADRAGVSPSTALRWRREHIPAEEQKRPGRPTSLECPAEVESLLGELTLSEFAERCGVCAATVRRWRRERGLQRVRGKRTARKANSTLLEQLHGGEE
jgi:uncharacterized protein YjcR